LSFQLSFKQRELELQLAFIIKLWMSTTVKIVEQYIDYKPPVVLYRVVPLLLRYVPGQHLAGLHRITLTNSAGLRKMYRGKVSAEKRRVRPADCRGLYSNGNIILVMDQIFLDCPEILLVLPPVKNFVVARTLYHEIGHHIHRLEQPGYRANREGFADEWSEKLVRSFMKRRYWYLGLLVSAWAKVLPSRGREESPTVESEGGR
jgi:hypothetical protein